MMRSIVSNPIAVLDIGKTNLKLVVASDDGWPLETHAIPNVPMTQGLYLAYDLAGLEEWFLDTLANVSQRHAIGAVIVAAHGCGAVLVDGNAPVLPMMDYDAVCPPEIDEAYARIAPGYDEVFCGIGGAMRLGKQLLWQESAYPLGFARAKTYLTTAQFFALRLGGRAASEISQLAAQSHIRDLVHGQPSSRICASAAGAICCPNACPPLSRNQAGNRPKSSVACMIPGSTFFATSPPAWLDASILSTGTG